VLLIDVMGTLVAEPFQKAIPAFFGTTRSELERLQCSAAWRRFERGEIDEPTYFASYFEDGRSFDREGLRHCAQSAYGWLDEMEALLDALHQRGVEMHALSNYSIWYQMIEDKLRVSRFIEWSFVSCRTGVRKPDDRAYLGAAQALGRRPDELLFIDDAPENCEAAERVGLDAIRFVGAEPLRRDLQSRGLLP
jgi:HAD superfamily hydrolase (TIGR01509 family)